jgi:ribose-phosphate pyrophosphokinase
MIDTGGTLAKAADLMIEKGAYVRAYVHMPFYLVMLTKNREIAIKRINSDRFYSVKERIKQNKSVELCTSFAEVMHVHHNNSISGKFIM